jgi:AraC-like DNA-binding protein
MIFTFHERPSDSPFVERIWRAQTEHPGTLNSIAASQWGMVVTRYQGKATMTVRGPETKATSIPVTIVGAEFFGIIFKHGTVMPYLPSGTLVDGAVDLPDASSKSFWLNGSAWQFPDYENADTFVSRLVQKEMLVHDPIVDSALRGESQELSPRSIQRRFLRTTGLTHGSIRQIERARYATTLLNGGVSIFDTVHKAGYADQPHLTRALKRFIGKTPAQIINKPESEQMSLLFKTEPFR